jgi:ATP-dependent Clp protease protease subunit
MDFKTDFKKYANSMGIPSMNLHQMENSLTPYILEERNLNVTQMDIFSRMMRDRVIWVYGGVDDNMSSILQAQMLYLENVDNQADIKLYISSPGGSVISGNGICDTMDNLNCDVATMCLGMAASMGAVILSNGTKGKRSSLISSRVMLHQASAGTQGHVEDMRINHRETEQHNFILLKRLARNTGKTFDEIYNRVQRDRWFNSDEAVDYGLIDEVIGTDKSPTITTQLEGFDDYIKMLSNK